MNNPTLSELYTSIQADLKAKLGITFIIGKVVLNAFALVQAAKLKILYLQANKIYKNIFPDTADPEAKGGSLERFGRVRLGRDPFAAIAGVYTAEVTGDVGATIPKGTTFKSLDNSTNPDKIFVLDTDYTLSSTTGSISIRSLELGPDSRLEVNDELQVTAPIALVNSFITITSVDTSPTASESIEEYRDTIIESFQAEPQGGSRGDFRLWSQDAAGVRKVYPYVKDGEPGIIQLYVEANPEDSDDGNGSPTPSILADVESVVKYDPDTTKPDNERAREPMGVFDVEYLSVNPLPVDVDIQGLSDTSLIGPIKDAVKAFLFDIRPFIDGADNPNLINQDRLFVSDILNIVKSIAGTATFTGVTMDVGNYPHTVFRFENGDIPYIRDVTNS